MYSRLQIVALFGFQYKRGGDETVTTLMEQAVEAIRNLPESEQDTIASLIMAEIADEAHWEEQFEMSQQKLGRWAEKVRADTQAGRVHRIGSPTVSPIS